MKGPFASARACRLIGERCGKQRGHCCGDASCRKGRSGGGVCVCPQSRTNCGGFCVDITSNPNACGATCAQCPPETDCCNGVCCPEGQRCCGGICTDLTADNNNCGGCTQQCPAGLTCCDSRCRLIDSDIRHCGKCYHVCGRNQQCSNGQCVCAPGSDCGDGICRDLQSDPLNCGVCRRQCGHGETCTRGECVCQSGLQRCGLFAPTTCGPLDNAPCSNYEECCSADCRAGRCWPCQGLPCDGQHTCCGGLSCQAVPAGGSYCGGCVGRTETCAVNSDCCFSDCVQGQCLSRIGGRCAADADCAACLDDHDCERACMDGRCRV
jgi:hypothetical protein